MSVTDETWKALDAEFIGVDEANISNPDWREVRALTALGSPTGTLALIVSAPELYRALDVLLREACSDCERVKLATLQAARKALAKARSER